MATVAPTYSARKPEPRSILCPEDRLWSWLRDRGRPEPRLGACALVHLSNAILAEELGVSERTVRYWAAKLRQRGLLSTFTYARKPRGLRGGTWKVWLAHTPEDLPALQRAGIRAILTIRGEVHPLDSFRASWGTVRQREPGDCRTTPPLGPVGTRGGNRNPLDGGAFEDQVRQDTLTMLDLGIPDPRTIDVDARHRRNAQGRARAGDLLASVGLRGRGLRAARGWAWRLFERLKSWDAALATVQRLVDRALSKRHPASWVLATLRAGFDRLAVGTSSGAQVPRPPTALPLPSPWSDRILGGASPEHRLSPATTIGDLAAELLGRNPRKGVDPRPVIAKDTSTGERVPPATFNGDHPR